MEWLNYHHLYYFFVVAREGGLSAASRVLRLSHPTLSRQVRQLEDALGQKLFERKGRRLELTHAGHRVYAYAYEIFHLGQELVREAKGEGPRDRTRVTVGVTPALPKLITRELLAPVFATDEPVELVVVEDQHQSLVERLATRELDVVLADAPVPPNSRIAAFNQRLGDSGLSFFAAPALAERLDGPFPDLLAGAPMLLPPRESAIRRVLDPWLERHGLQPEVAAQLDDLALIKAFGQYGHGVFLAPTLVEDHVISTYGVQVVGRTDELRETIYAITMRRHVDHALVAAICEGAQSQLQQLDITE